MPSRRWAALHPRVDRRRDGSEFPCEVSSRRVDLDGESFLVSVVRDLTDRLRAEATLREDLMALISDLTQNGLLETFEEPIE